MSAYTGLPGEFSDFKRGLEETLIRTLPTKRWFGKKSSKIISVSLRDECTLNAEDGLYIFTFVDAETDEHTIESYFIPLVVVDGFEYSSSSPQSILIKLGQSVAVDLGEVPYRSTNLLELVANASVLETEQGRIRFHNLGMKPHALTIPEANVTSSGVEQSNVSVFFDKKYFMKQYRHIAYGINPDLEVSEFLSHRAHFKNTPEPLGYAVYESRLGEALLLTVFEYVENSGDGWTHFTRILNRKEEQGRISLLEDCSELGSLTAKMHIALSSSLGDSRFEPEPVSNRDVQDWRNTYNNTLRAALQTCEKALHSDSLHKPMLKKFLEAAPALKELASEGNLSLLLSLNKIRVHGDYHLAQVLKTNSGYIIVDFEGEPLKSLEERGRKGFALKDVAGMLRSMSYAANYSMGGVDDNWARSWLEQARERFINSYWNNVKTLKIVPDDKHELVSLLRLFEAEKALYEVRYELENRPDWVHIPLMALLKT